MARQVAVDPAEDRPRPGIACSGASECNHPRDIDGQVRRKQREQVPVAMVRFFSRSLDARQPHREICAKAVDHVDSPVACALERQVGPLRELLGKQGAHELLVDLELIVVDPDQPNP